MNVDKNDPKLTAYALGELSETERAEFEQQIAASDELRRAVDEIRLTADLLTTELRAEGATGLNAEGREAIESRARQHNEQAGDARPWLIRRWRIPITAAASIILILGAGYVLWPGREAARRSTLQFAQADARVNAISSIKGIGTSAKIYAADDPNGWGIPALPSSLLQAKRLTPARESRSVQRATRKLRRPPASVGASQIVLHRASGRGRSTRLPKRRAPEVQDVVRNLDGLGYVAGATNSASNAARVDVLGGGSPGYSSVSGRVAFENATPLLEQAQYAEGHASFSRFTNFTAGDPEGYFASTESVGTESYAHLPENPFQLVTQQPLSTFSIDVDTASYSNVRRLLNQGVLPPPGAVRIEEMVNYFDYDYPLPTGEHPFSVNVEIADCPWNGDHRLARIGIKGQEFAPDERPPANLVFLIDVSGSMQPTNKLPLLKQAMSMLVEELYYDDYVSIVVYAGASGIVLDSTAGDQKSGILDALDNLQAGGSTNGGAGIQLAYDIAGENFVEGGVNRVILATDGDFNVGVTDQSSLTRIIEEKAKTGVFLTVLGFGMGNYKDTTLETLADKGNGNYAYIDTEREAHKVLVEQIGGTLVTIAKDVKIQVEFNPVEVAAYRLIGYENRLLAARDFNDDTKDAGEIGAGHTVTAFYEVVPAGVEVNLTSIDPLKYQTSPRDGISTELESAMPWTTATATDEDASSDPGTPTTNDRQLDSASDNDASRGLSASRDSIPSAALSGETMTVKLRYKEPDGDVSKLIEVPVTDDMSTLEDASEDFVFAASVASFGMLLRHGGNPVGTASEGPVQDFTLDAVWELAGVAIGEDRGGYRAEFLTLVEQAISLQPPQ